ncbi:hypothetical protein DPMN_172330 [Dreissena polymorpha]|uniref:Uncharacterized protein n=1 Tax=Dreissena polymorpha TaxID=45954 RepID=A0A9D4E2X3_DREPO|nr:hypothetical protein DPMN_172330 [Dreissena polymorpha]
MFAKIVFIFIFRHNQYYYIRIKTEEPGVVTLLTGVGCPEVKVTVAMNCDHIPYQRPQIVEGKGQEYMYILSCQAISQRC